MQPMSSNLKKLGIDGMGVEERLELIGEIWDSIANDPATLPVSDAHLAEIQRRLDAFAADGDPGRPAKEVIADIKRRL